MDNKAFSLIVNVIGIALLLFVAGCAVTSTEIITSREPESLASSVVVSPIPLTPTNLVANLTPSIEPTLTLAPTNTPTLTPTIESIVTEIPIAIPTPPGDDTNSQVLWMLETNNGCRLPCWWGITPGQTKWDEAEKILNLFDPRIYSSSASGLDYYNPTISLPFGPYEDNQVSPIYTVNNGVVEKIETQVNIGDAPSNYLSQYLLSEFLTTYGQPKEVWISTYASAFEENDLPFFVVLFYPTQGIIASYDDNGERTGDLVQGCPQSKPVSRLVLLPTSLEVTFEETVSKTSGLRERTYLSLVEASEMDVATFYETFVNPENTICLQTPANLWR